MAQTKRYFTGVPELQDAPAFREAAENEFTPTQTVDEFLSDNRLQETSTGRRDFLKFLGFSVGAATLAACETPVIKSIPYVNKPDQITPGIPNYYASTFYNGQDYGNVLVKTREGRPIFIKANKAEGVGYGAVNSRISQSVLELYDNTRLTGPMKGDTAISWSDLDNEVSAALQGATGKVAVVSGSVISPSTQRAINAFTERYQGRHVMVDSYSYNGIRRAHQATHGTNAIPQYRFDQAKVIVSINADFLGTWMTANKFTKDYGMRRKPEGAWMSQHIHFEGNMSTTGSNADERVTIKPSEEGLVAAALYNAIAGGASVNLPEKAAAAVKAAAAALQANRGESLVVAGSNDLNVQQLVNGINQALGNYGNTLDVANASRLYMGDDAAMASLVNDMKKGRISVLVVYGTNPSYTWYDAEGFNEALAKVKTTISFNGKADETGARCTYKAPDHHALEAWNDHMPFDGRVEIQQPTISPLFSTRYAQESLLTWAGDTTDYYTYMRQTHNPGYVADGMLTDESWNMSVYNGYFNTTASVQAVAAAEGADADAAAPAAPVFNAGAAISAVKAAAGKAGKYELSVYQKVSVGAGEHTPNPWAQELPDPVTKVTWDNYVTMSVADCEEMGLNTVIAQRDPASLVTVTVGDSKVTLPVFPTPGQKPGTIGIALGYGRGAGNENIGNAAYDIVGGMDGTLVMDENGKRVPRGQRAAGLVTEANGLPVYANTNVSIEKAEGTYSLATTQMHHTIMGRDSIVKETTLGTFLAEKDKPKGQASFNENHVLITHDGEIPTKEFDMWNEHPIEVGHRWGMTIDLTTCTGCSACVTACHLENNVPVVGKDEVLRHRDMHWMRIDRFFSSKYRTVEQTQEALDIGAIPAYIDMERPEENPETVHMPMMCQHCNHAPCETVCPVAATTHSNEGMNQMTYNRCIGTRYCANNCPYKVRRFNWFNYMDFKKFQNTNPAQDSLARMVLNPDVTVRSRGVMEKCSLCVQRIQYGKLEAKKAGQPVADGAIETACAEACPTHAIQFGDLNDKNSGVRAISQNNRAYHALEEIGVQPNMYYMTKVRNKAENNA